MDYQPLFLREQEVFEDEIDDDHSTASSVTRPNSIGRYRVQLPVFLLSIIAILELVIIFQKSLICLRCTENKWNVSYSPANDAVQYKIQTHYGDAGEDTSPFWGPPSHELDQKWTALSAPRVSKIPKHQAALLPNKTAPIPGDDKNYIVTFDVFHELHCLNMIRQALYSDHYPNVRMNTTFGSWHIRHCVDSVRQSLMCSADISVIVWQWNDTLQQHLPKGNIAHTCRNYEMVQEWARERELDFEREFDYKVHMEDDIVVPIYHST